MPRHVAELSPVRQAQQASYRRTLLFLIGFSLVLSASTLARIEVGGLLFQPVLLPVLFLFFLGGFGRLERIPPVALAAVTTFTAAYCVVVLLHGLSLGSLAKIGMVWLIIVTVASNIESDDDGRAATIGYALAMAVLAIVALMADSSEDPGVNPFAGISNENAFSIYALPSMLLSGHYIVTRGTPRATRILLILCVVAAGVGIFSTANRSGYLGVAFVALLLIARGRRLRDVLVLVVVGAVLYGGFILFGDQDVVDQELSRSRSASESESGFDVRSSLFKTSTSIGFEHPIVGVGPQNVMLEIRARYLESFRLFEDIPEVAPHNLYGALFAGGGLVLVSGAAFAGYGLWARPRQWKELGPPGTAEKEARALLRAMLVLFVFRGLFTEDVLGTPPFPLAIGVLLGLTIAAHTAAARDRVAEAELAHAPRLATQPSAPRPRLRKHDRRLVVIDQWKAPEPPPG